jgi:thioredoxin-related protein
VGAIKGYRLILALAFLASAASAAAAQDTIVWREDLAEAQAEAAKEQKPLIVVFVAGWCSACAAFERDTLPSPLITAHARHFIWVKLDVERNISLVRANEVRATPRIDLRGSDGVTHVRISGALPAEEFRKQLDLFLSAREGKASSVAQEVDGSSYTPLSETPGGFRGASICYNNVGYGPLRLGSQSPFQSLRFGIDPRTPSTLAEGQWEAHVTETWTNTFVYNPDKALLLDYEALDSRFSIAYGVLDELELELAFENRSGFGGIMDRFINAFHRTLGLTDAGRHNFDRNQFQIEIPDNKGNPAVSRGSGDQGSFTNALLLTVQHNVTCGTEYLPAIAYALTVRANLDNGIGLSGRLPLEPQLSLSVSKAIGDFYVYGSVAFGYFGDEHLDGIHLRPTQYSTLGAVEWRFASRMSLSVQYLVSQGVAKDLGSFSDPSHEITLGWKWEIVERTVFEFGLIENLIHFDNSPDFGVHAGLTVRF